MLADDLVQDAVVSAIAKHSQLTDPDKLFSWLYRILNNKWLEHLRRNKVITEVLDDNIFSDDPGPSAQCQTGDLVNLVRQVINTLPIKERQVISLIDLDEQSYRDVASALDIPIGTVMSRLHSARKRFLEKLDHQMNMPEFRRIHLHIVK